MISTARNRPPAASGLCLWRFVTPRALLPLASFLLLRPACNPPDLTPYPHKTPVGNPPSDLEAHMFTVFLEVLMIRLGALFASRINGILSGARYSKGARVCLGAKLAPVVEG